MKTILFFMLSFIILFNMLSVYADTNVEYAYDVLVGSEDFAVNKPVQNLITFYQRHISPRDGARCLYYPTCSQFYKIAHNNYGFFWGTLMVIDRLFYRESWSSVKYYEYIHEKKSYSDPVYHNYIFKKMDYYR